MLKSSWKAPVYISSLPAVALRGFFPRRLVILGSTGSIGCSALAVLEGLEPELACQFPVLALAAGRNIELLARQANLHRPEFLAVQEESLIAPLRGLLAEGYRPEIFAGQSGYAALAGLEQAEMVLSAQVGAAGLRATLAAARAGKIVALANKESLVLAGGLIRSICAESGAVILPVDSEHNALFQLLMERMWPEPVKLLITASGGPFRGFSRKDLLKVTPEAALKHPNWNMGAKISIDSATLMNKGLEVIEAQQLYGLPPDQIEVTVHRQSLVHSLICFSDGSQLAQLGTPDMRMPIAHAMAWPRRMPSGVPALSLNDAQDLSFELPDLENFPCLGYACEAMRLGGGLPIILNAANEIAVEAFLQKRIGFMGIPELILAAMNEVASPPSCMEEDILELDKKTRSWCLDRLAKM
ncbi:MAG: 1-deoxy-D-xylulose-5-phosphate reductoisomerase [Desulfovibrionaceae bacterium]|nr:1-deoxy-D-xylulose-5-phosphate reductoisomerase [Desulfovibrionaceae bacterium]